MLKCEFETYVKQFTSCPHFKDDDENMECRHRDEAGMCICKDRP